MNPETPQDMIPRVEAPRTEPPRTEPPRTDAPAPETAPPKKEKGLFGKYLDAWTDRDLDTEHCDTSDWNIFYYYYRHIYQKRAALKLKYLKWLALLFQLYFFGMIALVLVRVLLFSRSKHNPVEDLLSFLSMSSIQILIPLILLAPTIMVCAAFRLRTKNRGLMTSRAKEPPLLAHLVRYTTNRGLVRGALQSLFFTWRKFALQMLPCIVASVVLMICYAVFSGSPWAAVTGSGAIFSAVLFLLTLSLFFVMQFFCFRMDSLMVMIGVGALALAHFVGGMSGLLNISKKDNTFLLWIAMTAALIPTYAFAMVYFPLAAADTNEFGLGKTAKRIRTLLYSVIGFFFAALIAEDILVFLGKLDNIMRTGKDGIFALYTFLHAFSSWGLAVCISGLLVSSVSFTSQQAALLRRSRTEQTPFLRNLFDPASAWSLLPIVALEILFLVIGTWTFRHLYLDDNAKLFHDDPAALRRLSTVAVHTVSMRAMQVWTIMHIGLMFKQKHFIMDPWESHVPFNRICMISLIFIPLVIAMESAGIIFYLGSIFAFIMAKRCAPSETVPPAAKQENSAS